MKPLLHLANVARVYRGHGFLGQAPVVRAVDDVSLTLAPATTLGIVGESGCGKSTTGRLALGLERPDAGSVTFDGAPMPPAGSAAWRTLRIRMQLVFQDPLGALDRRLTIARQIGKPLRIHRIGTQAERQDRVAALLADVGLRADHGARYPHELSGGQRQRAVLARALATDPALLVCDEPVSALDVSIQAQVINMLAELQARRSIAMLFISHDLKVVRQIGHQVAVMYLGRIVEQGDPDTIFADPIHPYTQALVSAIPVPGPKARPRIVLRGEPPNPAARPAGCPFHPRCPVATADCAQSVPALKPLPDGRLVACLRAEISPASARIAA
jgi:peptide/nickel transport system ATP-binding protein